MAEFQEVMRQIDRICSQYKYCEDSGCILSTVCGPLGNFSSNAKLAMKTEELVMKWAAEHPEPIYPTWAEYLNSIGVTISDRPFPAPNIPVYVYQAGAKMFDPIPADIAEKLGIEPKEG